MLYYERAVHPRSGIHSGHTSASPSESRTITDRGKGMESEETLKPYAKVKRVELNGSAASLVSEVGVLSSKSMSGISLSMDNVKSEGGVDNLKQAESRANLTSMSLEPRIIRSVEGGRGERSVSVPPVLASAVTSQSRDLDAAPKDSRNPPVINGSAAPSVPTTTSSSNLARKIAKSPLTATMNGIPVLSSHSPLPILAETLSAATSSGPLSSSKPPPKSPSKTGKNSAKAGPPLVPPFAHVENPNHDVLDHCSYVSS
ncbi:hypothetical protein BKA70DRAFT_290813 [Coprinopsis sp. MPI-PUGE-AT-0042]|nr:hypothetical protein BKA70DRAFT_626922 [Coprinopsis sp. MPI-PUGE-AT-0042]KAH6908081.1 hypothetical protein BKA70DRAFT_290813 [Coprinopsis sp. MPI-PUGE-AT-0042]